MVQLVRDAPASVYRPPPFPVVEPPEIVRPVKDAVTFASTWNTRLRPPPLIVTPAAGPVIGVPPTVVSLSSSWVPFRVIVRGVLNLVLSKSIASAPPVEFA